MGLRSRLQQECARHKLWTNCYDVKYFTTSQWPVPPALYVAYRLLVLIHFLAFLSYSLSYAFTDAADVFGSKIFIFLTVQSYLVMCVHVLLSATLATVYYLSNYPGLNCQSARQLSEPFYHSPDVVSNDCHCPSDGCDTRPVGAVYKIHWILYNITANSALLVTVGYWGIVWPYLAAATNTSGHVSVVDFTLHASNSIYIALDLFVSATPLCLFHCWMPVVYGAYYGLFALVYWAAGGRGLRDAKFIYPMLDFSSDPGLAVATIVLGMVIVVPLLQVALWCYYRLRVYLYHRCYGNRATITASDGPEGDSKGRESYVEMNSRDILM